MATAWNAAKTTFGLVVFWAIFLIGVPLAISVVEIDLGIQRFPPQRILSTALLLVFTALSIAAVWTLARSGSRTPFWFDPPKQLVTRGPYAFMRHPFMAATTGQMVALGIALGSIPVIGYAAAWLALWYFLVRPGEERTIDARFGQQAADYRRHVRGFRPRLRPYRA